MVEHHESNLSLLDAMIGPFVLDHRSSSPLRVQRVKFRAAKSQTLKCLRVYGICGIMRPLRVFVKCPQIVGVVCGC